MEAVLAYFTVDKQKMKEINTLAILNVIREMGPISKADISRVLELNAATVSSNCGELEARGIVKAVREGVSTGGRKPTLMDLNSENVVILAISLGREGMQIGRMDLNGHFTDIRTLNYDKGRQLWAVFDVLGPVIDREKSLIKQTGELLLGIGCTLDGLIDPETGYISRARDFQWREVAFGKIMEDRFKVPVYLSGMGSGMAVGEHLFGAGADCDNFVHIHIGEGIYTGVYMNGDLYSGFNFSACNVGHHRVSSGNIKCVCGKSGCFEAVASYSGIVTRFINRLEEGDINKLLEYIQYDLANVNADMIYNMALQGDMIAQQVVRDTGRYIGRGLGAIVNMINPEKIFISGIYDAHNIMNRNINKHLAHSSIDRNLYQMYVGESGMPRHQSLTGAGAIVVDRLMKGQERSV